MGDYNATIERLEEMRSRFDDGFSASDRSFLEELNYLFFQKPISNKGCSDCYRDAYLILFNHLKKDKTMPKQANYILKNGALLHEFGTSEYYALAISDEVAEYFLKKDPSDINLFQKYPSDWKTRIKDSVDTTTEKVETPKNTEAQLPFADEEPVPTEKSKSRKRKQ